MVEARKLRVCCFGYNGQNNTGSEAKLVATLRTIREILGNRIEELAVVTTNVINQRRYLRAFPEVRLIEIPNFMAATKSFVEMTGYDVLFLVEGSTFIDHFTSIFFLNFCAAAWLAKLRGNRVVAFANDCGQLSPLNQRVLKKTVAGLDLVILRNPDAETRMRAYGITRNLHVTADHAYRYPLPSIEYRRSIWSRIGLDVGNETIIGIAPKEFFCYPIKIRAWGPQQDKIGYPFYLSWGQEGKQSSLQYIVQSAKFADWCVETYAAKIVLLSMEWADRIVVRRIRETMKHHDRAVIVHSERYDVDGMMSALSALSVLVTTRYHAAVLSSPAAVPTIAVSSDTRTEAIFRELGLMDYHIDYVRHPAKVPSVPNLDEVLIDKVRKLLASENEVRQTIAKAHAVFTARAQMNEVLLSQWVDATFP